MYQEINHTLPNRLKPLLAYRGGFSIAFCVIFLISLAFNYTEITTYNTATSSLYSFLKALLIPTAALFLLFYHLIKGIYFFTILKNGVLTKGKRLKTTLISSEYETFDHYKISFEYFSDIAQTKKHMASVKTYAYEKFENEPEKLIVFHKKKHHQALLVDDLAKPIANYIKQNWIT